MLWHSINSSRSPPMQIFSKHSVLSKLVLRPFLPWNNGVLSSSVCLPFYLDTIVRAQRGNVFTVYLSSTSFSYGLLQKKQGARAARKRFQYITRFLMDCVRKRPRAARKMFQRWHQFFSGLRRNRPESVCACSWNAKPRLPETFVYLKCNCDGKGNPNNLCR